jgi:hypothetical protein
MASLGEITKVLGTVDGEKRQMGPTHTIAIRIEVLTAGGPEFLEISQSAALELVEELTKRLRVRGCL